MKNHLGLSLFDLDIVHQRWRRDYTEVTTPIPGYENPPTLSVSIVPTTLIGEEDVERGEEEEGERVGREFIIVRYAYKTER